MSNVLFCLTSPAYSFFSRFIKLTLFEYQVEISSTKAFAFAVWPLSVEILSSVNEYAIYIQCNTRLLTRDTKSIYSFADYANSNWPWEGDVAAEEDAPSEFARLNACINFCCLLLAIIYIKYTHIHRLAPTYAHELVSGLETQFPVENTGTSNALRMLALSPFSLCPFLSLALYLSLSLFTHLAWPLWNLTHVAPTSHHHRSQPLRPVWEILARRLLLPLFHFSHVMCVIKVTKSKSYFLHWPQNLYLCVCVRPGQPFLPSHVHKTFY